MASLQTLSGRWKQFREEKRKDDARIARLREKLREAGLELKKAEEEKNGAWRLLKLLQQQLVEYPAKCMRIAQLEESEQLSKSQLEQR